MKVVEQFEEYAEKYPNIDFTELRDMRSMQVHAESVDLFSTKLPKSIDDTTPLQWYLRPDGVYCLRLIETKEHLIVKESAHGSRASGTVRGSYFNQDGWKSVEKAIAFADSMINVLGRGMMQALRRDNASKKKASRVRM